MTDLQSTAEKNSRSTARGDYTRWLARRFGSLDLMSIKEGEDKVHLRNIYIPLRIDPEDHPDESMGEIDAVQQEKLPGRDARDVIIKNRFVAISGRPGSGKTTLVQALINELCSSHSSSFRKAMVGRQGTLPIPLILREYQDELHTINSLDELLESWWRKAEEEANDKRKYSGSGLDIRRLKQSYDGSGDQIPLLLLFDGIDELGGVEPRNKIIKLAAQGASRGYGIVLTGRPSGYDGLDLKGYLQHGPLNLAKRADALAVSQNIPLYHAQPFTWPQIQQFIQKFYLLHDEWKVERERGIEDINNALQTRDYLLTLARRPIFLTLMSLVHVNDRRMPHGRADLYRRIIDLYLIRQTQQRRLKFSQDGKPMPHWEDQEVRRGLGYLAWLSQHRGGKVKKAAERDKRQVIWSRREMLTALQELLAGEVEPYHGRFRDIAQQEAETLLNYYLHPAGLLIEPADDQIQFAHLSFQEYLCAEYIHGRALAGGSRKFLDSIGKRLYKNLVLPGWDEVGMLLLTIHAGQGAQTEPTAHLELLVELNLTEPAEAQLLIDALTGRELDYAESELLSWLPVATATALIHPNRDFPRRFSAVESWQKPGLALLKELFRAEEPWDVLRDRVQRQAPQSWHEEHTINNEMKQRWQNPKNNKSWDVDFGPVEARGHALLLAAVRSGWIQPEKDREDMNPLGDADLEKAIICWLSPRNGILYGRDEQRLPLATPTSLLLDSLVPDRGGLWKKLSEQIPLDTWLLQGESYEDVFALCSQAPVLLSLYPHDSLPINMRLALGLYQCLLVNENLAYSRVFSAFSQSRSQSLSLSRLRSLSLLLSLLQSQSRSRSLSQSRSRSRSRSRSLSLSQSRSRSRSRSQSLSLSLSQSRLFIKDKQLTPSLRKLLAAVIPCLEQLKDAQQERFITAIGQFGFRYAAHDWFNEQAENPELMQGRGLRPGQPLPPGLGLFDETGRLCSPLPRQALVNLAEWLEHDEEILAWFFPEGLSNEWRENLLQQMQTLRGQAWSPQKAVKATLADWPASLTHRDTTLPALEQPLIEACELVLKEKG